MKSIFLWLFLLPATLLAQKPEVVLSTGHVDIINCIDISPDGEWMATGSVDKLVKIAHIATGRELRTFSGNDGTASMVRFSPDSKHVAGLFNHGEIKVWDINSGELVTRAEAETEGMEVDFVMDGKFVLGLGDDYKALLIPIDGGEPKLLEGYGTVRMRAAVDGKSFFATDFQGKLFKIGLPGGEKLAEYTIFDKFVFSPAPMEVSPDGRFVAIAFDDQHIHLFDTQTLKEVAVLKGHKTRIWSVDFCSDKKRLFSCDHDGQIMVWDLQSFKNTSQFKVTVFSPMCMEAHPSEPYLFIADAKDVLYVNPESKNVLRRFRAQGNKVVNMAYSPATSRLVAATVDVSLKVWDMQKVRIDKVLTGFWPVIFSRDGNTVFGMYMSINIGAWDPVSGDLLYQMTTDNELIQNLSVSPDGKYMAGGGFFGIMKIWNLESRQLEKRLTGHVGGIYNTSFSPDGKLVASSGMDGSVRVWDVQSGKSVQVLDKAHEIIASDVQFSPDGKYLATAGWDMMIHLWSTETWQKVKTLEGHNNVIYTIDWHSSSKYLASGSGNNAVRPADNTVRVWDVESGETICIYRGHLSHVNKVKFDPTMDGRVLSCGDDGAVRIWDFRDCSEKASLFCVNKIDHVAVTADHYYMASKPALQGISFRKGAELFPFEQFDLWLNRPDLVTSAVGKTPQNLVNAYNYAYRKRVEKMGFDANNVGGEFHVPEISITTANLPLVTSDTVIKITVRAADSQYMLDRIKVTVNDVPAGGPLGDNLRSKNVQSAEYTVPVRLSPGENRISFSVYNEKGIESLGKSVTILRDAKDVKGRLFLITMGVTNYKDARFNLKYAAKDARDVATTLSAAGHLYAEVKKLELLDDQVTLEGMEQVRQFIAGATADDAVIIFLAGHGVLDNDFNYYFASHDMDFNAPAGRGIPYAALEGLLAGARARKKLLFMDTCHSGEVDKTELEQIKEVQTHVEEVEFRNAGAGVRAKDPFGYGNSVELMQGLFTDINTGTGATVISSSGGAEYAMESDEWQNGLFTYALIMGINQFKADTDWNREIFLNELRAYVYKQVQDLSGGLQKPGTREENIGVDFRVK
jgi:WD40 repeat protein/uncharacterized caspase-like protein